MRTEPRDLYSQTNKGLSKFQRACHVHDRSQPVPETAQIEPMCHKHFRCPMNKPFVTSLRGITCEKSPNPTEDTTSPPAVYHSVRIATSEATTKFGKLSFNTCPLLHCSSSTSTTSPETSTTEEYFRFHIVSFVEVASKLDPGGASRSSSGTLRGYALAGG